MVNVENDENDDIHIAMYDLITVINVQKQLLFEYECILFYFISDKQIGNSNMAQ